MENQLIGKMVSVIGYEENGPAVIKEICEEEYPIFVEFINKELHESEQNGLFKEEQLNFLGEGHPLVIEAMGEHKTNLILIRDEEKYMVRKDNFDEFIEMFVFCVKYSIEHSIALSLHNDKIFNGIINRIIEAGYCPDALMNHILTKYEMSIKEGSKQPNLKQKLEDDFVIDLGEFSTDIDEAYNEYYYNEIAKFKETEELLKADIDNLLKVKMIEFKEKRYDLLHVIEGCSEAEYVRNVTILRFYNRNERHDIEVVHLNGQIISIHSGYGIY